MSTMTLREEMIKNWEILRNFGACPIEDYMIAAGFDPKDGCILVLPENYGDIMPLAPSYVQFFGEQFLLIRPNGCLPWKRKTK